MFLKKLRITSNASRNVIKFKTNWFFGKSFRQLISRKYHNAGRGSSGRTLVWTKSSIKKRSFSPQINYNFRLKLLSFVSTFKIIPFQNKLLSLNILSSGGVSYLPTTQYTKLLSFNYFFPTNRKLKSFLPNPNLFLLFFLKRLSRISLLELFPGSGVKYIRSSGTVGKLIKTDLNTHTSLIQLPSGVRKTFSIYSLVSLGSVSLKNKKMLSNTKSGYWRNFGVKPINRGVARNPVDHPHGGRTKSIKYPRTPWGKTTKFK